MINKKEKFFSGYRFVFRTIVGSVVLLSIAYVQRGFPLNQSTVNMFALFLGAILLTLWYRSVTYLEIQDERILINSGYRDFGKDILDIRDIKYIYRVPQFIFAWYGGSLMVLYHRDNDGKICHSALRERNYSDETLKQFLLRIKTIKPNIELDSEYEDFLKGKLELRSPSKNTIKSVEARLKEKGETWK